MMCKDDVEHCKLANSFIHSANQCLKSADRDFVASALVAASAAFALFNLKPDGPPYTDADIELALDNYRRRLETFRRKPENVA